MKNKMRFMCMTTAILIAISSCNVSKNIEIKNSILLPNEYSMNSTSIAIDSLSWRDFFQDSLLCGLIDSALVHNQELNIIRQEIELAKNEIKSRKGEYLPFVGLRAASGFEKEGEYTKNGAVEQQLFIKDTQRFPEPLGDFGINATASWELDIWKKLRNAKTASFERYLASIEGQHFAKTNLIAEIAEKYYELIALDNFQNIIQQNISIQQNALSIISQQKTAGKVSQLAVNRFEAQLLNTTNLAFEIQQKIVETENKLAFLSGTASNNIKRQSNSFEQIEITTYDAGIPSELLTSRPDIRQAEHELVASKLDIKVARANFYPSFSIKANLGFQAFNPAFIVQPQSLMYNVAGDLLAPIINRNAIKAAYSNAQAKNIQSLYNYERVILNGYLDVLNHLNKIHNYNQSLDVKEKEVNILNESVAIANNLFNSARADYNEVLLTQREALNAKLEWIEIKLNALQGKVGLYRAVGGGW